MIVKILYKMHAGRFLRKIESGKEAINKAWEWPMMGFSEMEF